MFVEISVWTEESRDLCGPVSSRKEAICVQISKADQEGDKFVSVWYSVQNIIHVVSVWPGGNERVVFVYCVNKEVYVICVIGIDRTIWVIQSRVDVCYSVWNQENENLCGSFREWPENLPVWFSDLEWRRLPVW